MAALSKGDLRTAFRRLDDLDAIVCVNERLGLPAHSFPYIRMVGNMLPDSPVIISWLIVFVISLPQVIEMWTEPDEIVSEPRLNRSQSLT